MDRLKQAMKAFELDGLPEKLTETAIASLWKTHDGRVLKLYHGDTMESETSGVLLLQSWPETAVQIVATTPNAILMECLPGNTLGDLFRSGFRDEADRHLSDLALRAHATALPVQDPLPTLDLWFEALFNLALHADCPMALRHDMERATQLAQTLVSGPQSDWRPLHGDLHHDNVLEGADGYRAIDAKGVVGARGYELANAVRNPKGAEGHLLNTDFQTHRITRFADAMGISVKEQTQWAAAKCALSIAWRAKGMLKADKEADLLDLLLSLSER